MQKARTLQVGARVKIRQQHWKRGGQVGRVISYEPRGRNNWLIQFGTKYPGGGIDGDKLWLDQSEFADEFNEADDEADIRQ